MTPNNNNTSLIHVVLASDQKYYTGLLVSACSIVRFAAKDKHIVLHVLDGGLNAESVGELGERVFAINPNVEIDRINVNESSFANIRTFHGSRMAYARILLTELLPDVDFVVYSDVDVLWMIDIAELWNLRDQSYLIQGCIDTTSESVLWREKMLWQKFNKRIKFSGYINTGVLVMNLARLRARGDFQIQVLEFLEKNTDAPFADQSAINFLYEGAIGFLPAKFNVLINSIDCSKIEKGLALHYAGDFQPWRAKGLRWMFGDDMVIWHRVNSLIRDCSFDDSYRIICGKIEFAVRRMMFYFFSAWGGVFARLLSKLGTVNRWWAEQYYLRCNKRIMKLLPKDFFSRWR